MWEEFVQASAGSSDTKESYSKAHAPNAFHQRFQNAVILQLGIFYSFKLCIK